MTASVTTGLPLTRRALAAFVRWRQGDGKGRAAWAATCGLHPDEARALEGMEANLIACGAPSGWWVENASYRDGIGGLHLKAGLAERLCQGLVIDDAALRELVKLVGVHEGWPRVSLERALRKWLEMPESAEKRERKEQPMETATSNGAAGLTPTEKKVLKALQERGVPLDAAVPASMHRQVAAVVGCSQGSISVHLAAIRRKMGLEVGTPNGTHATESTCERCGKPRHPGSARVCRACYEAAGATAATVEVQPAAVLNEPEITERELEPEVPAEEPQGRAYDLLEEVAKAHRERDDLRRERDETAKALAEVQDERDRLKGARGPDPALGTLRAQVEQLKADSATWEARAQEAGAKRDAAVEALVEATAKSTAERDAHAATIKRLEGLKVELGRERDAARGQSERRAAQIETLKKAHPHRSPSGLNPEGRKMAVQLAAGEPLDMRGWPLATRIAMLALALDILELATR